MAKKKKKTEFKNKKNIIFCRNSIFTYTRSYFIFNEIHI